MIGSLHVGWCCGVCGSNVTVRWFVFHRLFDYCVYSVNESSAFRTPQCLSHALLDICLTFNIDTECLKTKMSRNSTSTDDFDIESQIPGAFPQSEKVDPTFTTQLSLSQALYARRSEYTRPQNIRIKIGTWNIAALKGTEKDVTDWFIEGKGIEKALTSLDLPVQDHLCSVNGSQQIRNQESGDETGSVEYQETKRSKIC